MAIDTEEKRASAASAGTWLTRVLRPTGSVGTADRVFIVREYTGLTYGEPAIAGIAVDFTATGAVADFRATAAFADFRALGDECNFTAESALPDFRARGEFPDYRALRN